MNPDPNSEGRKQRGPAPRWTVWLGWTVAVACALATGYATFRTAVVRTETSVHRQTAELAQMETKSLQQTLEAERIVYRKRASDLQRASDPGELRVAHLRTETGSGHAVAIWNPIRRDGLLDAQNLPLLGDDEEYHLWVFGADSTVPTDAGSFSVDPHGGARVVIRPANTSEAVSRIQLTREQHGSSRPAGPVVASATW